MKQERGHTGASFKKCSSIENLKGSLRHVLISENDYYLKISEIYFSEINPKSIKAWKLHSAQTQNISVAFGKVRIICINERVNSLIFDIFDIDSINTHGVLTIPPRIYYAIINLSETVSVLLNGTDINHDPNENYSIPMESKKFINLMNKYKV